MLVFFPFIASFFSHSLFEMVGWLEWNGIGWDGMENVDGSEFW